MRLGRKFSFKFSLFVIFLIPLFSCTSSSTPNANEAFQKKYGKQVDKIKAERIPSEEMKKDLSTPQSFAQSGFDENSNPASSNSEYYAYVDVSKFGEKSPQKYLPDGESYEQNRGKNIANSLPADVFEVVYNTELYPPFRRAGVEFDGINIPESDVYGVKTQISEKPYLLMGNNSLQKNLDHIEITRTAEDVEMSEILMSEQKQLRRKEKMIKMFGRDSIELASAKKSEKKSDSENSLTESGQKKSSENKLKQVADMSKDQASQQATSSFSRTILK